MKPFYLSNRSTYQTVHLYRYIKAVPGTLGVTGTTTLGAASLSGNLEMSSATAALTHTASLATSGLSISSTNGFVVGLCTLNHVDP